MPNVFVYFVKSCMSKQKYAGTCNHLEVVINAWNTLYCKIIELLFMCNECINDQGVNNKIQKITKF